MADSRWMQRLERGLGSLGARIHRRPGPALLGVVALALAGTLLSSRLSLNTDLVDLLPASFASVQGVHKLEQRFGGIGWMVVVGEGAEPAQLRRFARDLAPKLEALEGVRFVEYERSSAFFEERALYYLERADLEEVQRRLEARERYERRRLNPLFVQLEEEAAPPLDFADLEEKYAGQSSQRLAGTGEAFYLDPGARQVVLMGKPQGQSADLTFSAGLVREVEALLATVDTKQYGPTFRTAITGTFKKKVDQQAQVARDIVVSSSLALAVLLLYLALHFRSALAVGLTLAPVGVGLAWTYGLVAVGYGQVNLLSGFLGAILGGLGIEHGIHLLTRYFYLRGQGLSSEEATRESFTHTGGSALISALVAALTFFTLALSEFRAFREFGLIAGVGMLVMVAAYVLVLPALLGVASRRGWRPPRPPDTSGSRSWLARTLPRLRWPVALGMGAVLALLTLNMRHVRFDYDFEALEDQQLPSFVLDKQVNKILGYSQTPVVILTDTPEHERVVVDELSRRKRELGARSTVDFVAALDDLVPREQEAKQQTLQRIAGVLAKVKPARLDPETRERFEQLRRAASARPFTRDDLPASVKRQFRGASGDTGGFVLVFPRINLSDGDRVREFAREVRAITLPGGGELSAAGEPMVLADIIEMVIDEGPPILIGAVLAVLAAMWLTLGSLKNALLCITPTLVSVLALMGLMPLLHVPFNYLNILVVPVLVGTTVDAGVHLLSRLSDKDTSRFTPVYAETGRAICGGLLTSAVGFSALMLAAHPGLNSIGQLANLGMATNLLVMVLAFPALLLVLAEGRRRRQRTVPGSTGVHGERAPA